MKLQLFLSTLLIFTIACQSGQKQSKTTKTKSTTKITWNTDNTGEKRLKAYKEMLAKMQNANNDVLENAIRDISKGKKAKHLIKTFNNMIKGYKKVDKISAELNKNFNNKWGKLKYSYSYAGGKKVYKNCQLIYKGKSPKTINCKAYKIAIYDSGRAATGSSESKEGMKLWKKYSTKLKKACGCTNVADPKCQNKCYKKNRKNKKLKKAMQNLAKMFGK